MKFKNKADVVHKRKLKELKNTKVGKCFARKQTKNHII